MMVWPYTVLLLFPSVTALAVGWAVRSSGMAIVVAAVAAGCFLMVPVIGGAARHVSTVFTSAVFSALTLMPLLFWKPALGAMGRMAAALATSFTAHFLFLQAALKQI